MVTGSTTLQDPTNDVNVIAADNGDVTLFTDADDLTVGSVLVDGMLVTGITTVDADAKLLTGGNLAVNAAVNLGLGDLFLASTGNVTQTASIQSDGLGLMVTGSTTLQDPTNDVNVIAARQWRRDLVHRRGRFDSRFGDGGWHVGSGPHDH